MFHSWGKKEKNKMPLQIILFVWAMCFCWKTGVCKKGIFLVCQFQLSAILEWKATALSQQPPPKEMPISQKPWSQRDLSCFLTGHKGTWAFYLNFFWENCLLDVDFQQALPSMAAVLLGMLMASIWTLYTLFLHLFHTCLRPFTWFYRELFMSGDAHSMDCCWVNS